MKVLSIIVSYNIRPWVDSCIGSLVASELHTDILVIDNNSSDDGIKALESLYPQVRIIKNSENLGFGKANNLGMRIAIDEGYDAVLLLNQDASLNPSALRLLAETAEKHQDYAIVSPVHTTKNETIIEKGFSQYTGIKTTSNLPADKEIIEVNFINAAIWYIRTPILKTIGFFDPIFYHYGEDKDYANRVHYHKLKIGYVPRARGCHYRNTDTPPSRKAFARSERTYLLSEYTNINYSLPQAFAKSVLAVGKKIIVRLMHRDFITAADYISTAFFLIGKTPKIIAARKRNYKKPNPLVI